MPYTATAKEYRRRAEGVRAAAKKTPPGAAREALLELASRWDQLAEYKTEQEPRPPIDRAIVMDHLALAERHVREGERHVARQREAVLEFERDGYDAGLARRLLQQFEVLQKTHIADRDRLRAELAAMK
jgi:hypothetical protein